MQRGLSDGFDLGSLLGLGSLSTFILFAVGHNEAVELAEAGAGGYEVTANYVLLHAFEGVGLTTDGGFVEHLGGLLEGGG